MKRTLMSLALIAAGLVGPSLPLLAQERPQSTTAITAAATPDPAQQIRDAARLLRADDLVGLFNTVLPPMHVQHIRLAYEMERSKPITEAKRADFAEGLAKLTDPKAVDLLMAEIEPELEKARPQVPGALLMGFGAMQLAIASPDSDLTEEQRAALQSALPGVQRWASSTDFLSSSTLREALTLLTDAARQTGISDLDHLYRMPLDEVLERAGGMLTAAKQAGHLYGLDVNAILDSLQVEVLEIDGHTARVRTSVILFDAPIWAEHDLRLVDGRWFGKSMAHKFAVVPKLESEG